MESNSEKVFTRRHAVFATLAVVVVAIDLVALTWLLPGTTARLAVRQLEPDDSIAAAVRTTERTKNLLVTVSGVLLLVAAVGLADLPLRWRDQRRRRNPSEWNVDAETIEVEVSDRKEDQ